jgi:hypothetical protein
MSDEEVREVLEAKVARNLPAILVEPVYPLVRYGPQKEKSDGQEG